MGLNLERKNQLQRTSLIDTTVYDGEMMFNQLRKKGVHINHQILKSRTHRKMEVNGTQYKGVNELGDKIIDDTFGISREKTENEEIID